MKDKTLEMVLLQCLNKGYVHDTSLVERVPAILKGNNKENGLFRKAYTDGGEDQPAGAMISPCRLDLASR